MVSMKITVMAVTLCILATNTHAAYFSCCRRYFHGKPRFSEIMGFSMQRKTEFCPFRAIIFYTKTRKICVNPSQQWVMDYITLIEDMAKRRSSTGYGKQREHITEKVHQEAEPQPEDSFDLVSDKINEDGPLPMTLCKW